MKNNIINWVFFIFWGALVVGLRQWYGLYNSLLLCGPLVTMILFVVGWIKAKCSLWGYIGLLHGLVTEFITNTAKNYDSVKWYKQPKYWLVGLFFLFQFIHMLFRIRHGFSWLSIDDFVISWSWFLILMPFLLRGYKVAFYLYILISVVGLWLGVSWRFQYMPLFVGAIALWKLAKIYLIVLCVRIESQRNKLAPHRKPIFKDILTALIVTLFVVGGYRKC